MQRVFTAATLLEAYLVQQMLEAEFIPAAVFNENAHGAAGELPITEVWPEVWIKDDRHRSEARSIIERYETTSSGETPPHVHNVERTTREILNCVGTAGRCCPRKNKVELTARCGQCCKMGKSHPVGETSHG